jgi:hypothetical protein
LQAGHRFSFIQENCANPFLLGGAAHSNSKCSVGQPEKGTGEHAFSMACDENFMLVVLENFDKQNFFILSR